MEIKLKKDIPNFSLPLPIYETIHFADAVLNTSEEFYILIGLDKSLVAQMEKYSADHTDTDLQKFTGDYQRYVEGKYEDWYKLDPAIFALVDKKTGALAATVRFRVKPFFEDRSGWHTVAWRSYKPWRGRGFMKDFARFALDAYMKHFPACKMWLSARKDNPGSWKLGAALGFEMNSEASNRYSHETGKDYFVMIKK